MYIICEWLLSSVWSLLVIKCLADTSFGTKIELSFEQLHIFLIFDQIGEGVDYVTQPTYVKENLTFNTITM